VAQLNHTIVYCRDKAVSSRFTSDLLGLGPATSFGPFLDVELANGVTLAYHETTEPIVPQHYAFLVTEREFDEIFARLRTLDLAYWARPDGSGTGTINHEDGGRGVYFEDVDGHLFELLTRPYGSGPITSR
jgi:catechol 2,3-dioxygenase-like lactoylglutathione lyase family enzyme